MELNLRNPIAFFDLETTGINVAKDSIIELCFIKHFPNGKQKRYNQRINPKIPIPSESSLIHGIYDKDVKDMPLFKDIAKELAKFLEGTDLAGFSIINFDVPMLMEEFLRVEVDFDISKKKIVDTQKIFHLMEKRNLSSAYKFYCNKELINAHSAEADTLASLEILKSQISKYEGKKVETNLGEELGILKNDMGRLHQITMSNKLDLAGRIMRNSEGIEVFNFGKYKGKAVEEVFKREPQYYDWIMKGDFPLDTKKHVTQIKLKGFVK